MKHRIAIMLTAATLATGCLADPDSVVVDGDEDSSSFTDPQGMRWVKVRDVTYAEDGEAPAAVLGPEIGPPEDEPNIADMSVREIAEKMRPLMEFQGVEYTLDEASLWRFAEKVKRDAAQAFHESSPSERVDPEQVYTDVPEPLATNGVRVPRGVFGFEERVLVPSPWFLPPMKWIGVYGSATAAFATVFKVHNHYTAMGAAHSQHDGTSWLAPRAIGFGHSATSPSPTGFATAACNFRTVPAGWNASNDKAYDYAVLGLRGGGANCVSSTYNVGYFGYQTIGSGVTGLSGTVAGYPDKEASFAPGGLWLEAEMFTHTNNSGYTSSAPLYPTQLWHQNDSNRGQSGAPYWTESGGLQYVRAVHWGYDPGYFTQSNGGRRFTSEVVTFLQQFAGY
ncbi:hypothetical protein WME76_07175 [Sorangium sp. So ce119]|uniref:trypsin-like serine peptidase n=1 Tax=Sorangium sp. So ce119 TaxID=3133279 RepID=UPI003F60B23C